MLQDILLHITRAPHRRNLRLWWLIPFHAIFLLVFRWRRWFMPFPVIIILVLLWISRSMPFQASNTPSTAHQNKSAIFIYPLEIADWKMQPQRPVRSDLNAIHAGRTVWSSDSSAHTPYRGSVIEYWRVLLASHLHPIWAFPALPFFSHLACKLRRSAFKAIKIPFLSQRDQYSKSRKPSVLVLVFSSSSLE